MTNIQVPPGVQAFNLWTYWIVAQLWEGFPKPQFFFHQRNGVFVSTYAEAVPEPFGPSDPDLLDHFRPTIDSLLSGGCLTGKSNHYGNYALVALTEKSFTVLKESPRSLGLGKEDRSLGTLIREAGITHATAAFIDLAVKTLTGGHGSAREP
jgi:hypothetical protein